MSSKYDDKSIDLIDEKQEKSEELSIEEVFEKLEKIVTKLDEGKSSLKESLSLFEDGVNLCRLGTEQLDQAEQMIERLVIDNETGEEVIVPVDENLDFLDEF